MPRPKNLVPAYKLHKPTDTARSWVNGAWLSLGRYNSPESRQAHARLCAELAVGSPKPIKQAATASRPATEPTVDEIALAFWKHAEQHYRRADGTNTNELVEYRYTIRVLRELYGFTPAQAFGPLALKVTRTRMIELGWCRSLINNRIGKIRRLFKWAASEQLVPVTAYQGLTTVVGLQRGRTAAREPEAIGPVALEHVWATLPHLRPGVAAMAELQLLTGCRPGEVCAIRPIDIDMAGPVWLFKPPHHKMIHRGKSRVIAIGPRGQVLLKKFAPPTPEEFYFCPAREVASLRAEQAAARKTPRYPSHMKRNADKRLAMPKWVPGGSYTTSGYEHALRRAVGKANRALIEASVDVSEHVPNWHPNQLRHTHASAVRKRFSLEHAGAALGHSKMSATEIYAERDAGLAALVASEMG